MSQQVWGWDTAHSKLDKCELTPGCVPAAHYYVQSGASMSRDEYGLVQLRHEMQQGREDALPGMSLLNKADGYWVPLRQVPHFTPYLLLPFGCVQQSTPAHKFRVRSLLLQLIDCRVSSLS